MMYIRQTTERDLEVFTPALHDILEANAMGIEPSFPPASECVTLSRGDTPLAIGGNCEGQCWFVTSAHAWHLNRRDKLTFRRLIMTHRDELLERYEVLWNYVWVGNEPHIRFLKTIGAVFHEEYLGGGQFQLFTIRR